MTTITIPTDLHMSTGDRLRLVADLIEAHPKHWDQRYLYAGGVIGDGYGIDYTSLDEFINQCGSTGCAAGWGALTVPVTERTDDPEDDARVGFGLDDDLAEWLFYDTIYDCTKDVAPVSVETFTGWLRTIADLPEPRTRGAARAAGLPVNS